VIGLETELAVSITELIDKGILDWLGLVEKLSFGPARILGIKKGTLGEGSDADIIVVNEKKEWVVTRNKFLSKSKNSSFIDKKLKGVVEVTLLRGEIAYQAK
jgi:dihydroorotase